MPDYCTVRIGTHLGCLFSGFSSIVIDPSDDDVTWIYSEPSFAGSILWGIENSGDTTSPFSISSTQIFSQAFSFARSKRLSHVSLNVQRDGYGGAACVFESYRGPEDIHIYDVPQNNSDEHKYAIISKVKAILKGKIPPRDEGRVVRGILATRSPFGAKDHSRLHQHGMKTILLRERDKWPPGAMHPVAPALYHDELAKIVSKVASYKTAALWAVSYRGSSDERLFAVAGSVKDEDETLYAHMT